MHSSTDTAPRRMPEAFQALDERYARLPIEFIVPSKTNPRTHFDQAYLDQLAISLAEKGVLEPILVRPRGKERYEIVAGECRYRAARLAELSHLPAIIRPYSDEQALEIQLIENIHRRDLAPLEQAKGYRALIDSNPTKHSAESIAARIGMSPAWVWDRMKLLDLVPEAKQLLAQDRITIGHAILIARLKDDDQKRTIAWDDESSTQFRDVGLWRHDAGGLDFDEDDPAHKGKKPGKYDHVKPCSVRELDAWIRDHIRFDVAHAAKAQPLVFEQTAAVVDLAAAQSGRGKKLVSITYDYRVADDARDERERTYGREAWHRADGQEQSKTCEYSALGVVVAGERYGDTFRVCVNRDKCKVHFGAVIRQREKAAKLREQGKGTQARRVEKRAEASWERQQRQHEEARKRWEGLRPHAVAACVAKVKDAPLTNAVLQGVIAELLESRYGNTKDFQKLLGTATITTKNFVRALSVLEILQRDATCEQFQATAKRYRVDLKKLEQTVTQTSGVQPRKSKGAAA